MMGDCPLRGWRYKDGADTASCQDQRQRKATTSLEPAKNGACIRELRGAVGNQSKNEKREVKLADAAAKPAERSQRQSEHENGRQDDAPGRESVQQHADERRHERNGDGSGSEGAVHRLALPAEGSVQRIQK